MLAPADCDPRSVPPGGGVVLGALFAWAGTPSYFAALGDLVLYLAICGGLCELLLHFARAGREAAAVGRKAPTRTDLTRLIVRFLFGAVVGAIIVLQGVQFHSFAPLAVAASCCGLLFLLAPDFVVKFLSFLRW